MRLIFGRLCQTHEDTAVEHMGCCGCGGFWQTNVKVLRKREEVGGITPQKGRCRHWGKYLGWEAAESHIHSLGFGSLKLQEKKKCLSQHAPNTMNFDGHDLEWEFKALLKHITSTVQCCVDLDLVFHWVNDLPKSDLCWMHRIFLTAVEFSFGRQNNSEC